MAIASNMALDFKNNTFKIVHITSYVNGGAGTAAYRIHEALMKQGYDSSFLSLDKAKDEMKGCYQVIAPPASFFARFVFCEKA